MEELEKSIVLSLTVNSTGFPSEGQNVGTLVRFLHCAPCCFKMECLIGKGRRSSEFFLFPFGTSVPGRSSCGLRLGFLHGPGLIIELLKERELRVSLMRENGKRDQAGPDYFKLTEGVVTEGVVTEGVVY